MVDRHDPLRSQFWKTTNLSQRVVGVKDSSPLKAISLKSARCAVTLEKIDALVETEIATTMVAMMWPSFASKLRCTGRGRLRRKSVHCQSFVAYVTPAVQMLFLYFGWARRRSADGSGSYSNHNPKSYWLMLTAVACFSKSHIG